MPESRDRLQRPEDPAAFFTRWRSGAFSIMDDEPRTMNLSDSSSPWRAPPTTTTTTYSGAAEIRGHRGGARVRRGGFGSPRMRSERRRNIFTTPSTGRENPSRRRSRGRVTNSQLPSWYPRSPLQDITAVMRAVERRRAVLAEGEGQLFQTPALHDRARLSQQGQQFETPVPQRNNNVSSALLKHNSPIDPPCSSIGVKIIPSSFGKVPKILLSLPESAEDSEFLTPQKKLLNSIDTVEKVVKEELQKLQRTPIAKRADRDRRVRTLMSMR